MSGIGHDGTDHVYPLLADELQEGVNAMGRLYGPTAAAGNGRVVVPSRGCRVVARGRAVIEAAAILD